MRKCEPDFSTFFFKLSKIHYRLTFTFTITDNVNLNNCRIDKFIFKKYLYTYIFILPEFTPVSYVSMRL